MDTVDDGSFRPDGGTDANPTDLRSVAHDMLQLRKAAKSNFGEPVFSEPAWNLMLALCAMDGAPGRVHIGSVADGAGIARSTALRWLTSLQRHGFVSLTPDKRDKRTVRVALTPSGRSRMQQSFTGSYRQAS